MQGIFMSAGPIGVWEVQGWTAGGHAVPLGTVAMPLDEGLEAARQRAIPDHLRGPYAAVQGACVDKGAVWMPVYQLGAFRQALCEAHLLAWASAPEDVLALWEASLVASRAPVEDIVRGALSSCYDTTQVVATLERLRDAGVQVQHMSRDALVAALPEVVRADHIRYQGGPPPPEQWVRIAQDGDDGTIWAIEVRYERPGELEVILEELGSTYYVSADSVKLTLPPGTTQSVAEVIGEYARKSYLIDLAYDAVEATISAEAVDANSEYDAERDLRCDLGRLRDAIAAGIPGAVLSWGYIVADGDAGEGEGVAERLMTVKFGGQSPNERQGVLAWVPEF
jgi:hypothetical protein